MTREQVLEEKERLRREYGSLFNSIAALLFRHDPIGINCGTNTDEYVPEARTIVPRLKECRSEHDVTGMVYEEFVGWFSKDDVGSKELSDPIGSEIWQLWQACHEA